MTREGTDLQRGKYKQTSTKAYWSQFIAVFVHRTHTVFGWLRLRASAGWTVILHVYTVIFVNSGNVYSLASTAKREAHQLKYI